MADIEYGALSGEPDIVESHAAQVAQVADKIDAAVAALRKLQSLDGMQGEAIRKLSATAGKVADDIVKAKGRYVATGAALAGYAPELRQAKTDAQRAVVQIEQLSGRLSTAKGTQADAADAVQSAGDDPQQALQQKNTADAKVQSLSSDLATWQAAWHTAAKSKDDAGNTAADRVHDSDQHDGLKDGWRDKVSAAWHAVTSHVAGFLKSEFFDRLLQVLDAVTAVLGVIALVIAVIPGVDLADLGILPVLAVLGGLTAAGHLAQDWAKGDYKAMIFDGIVGVVSIFGGGVVGVMARNFSEVARPVATLLRDSGEVAEDARGMLAEGDQLLTKLGSLREIGAKIGSRANAIKSGLNSGWNAIKAIGADGGNFLKTGPYGWIIDGIKDPYQVLGMSGDAIRVLQSGKLTMEKMVTLSLTQGAVAGVRIKGEVDQIKDALGL